MSDAPPPPLPPSVPQRTIFHQLATVSWASVLVSIVVNLFLQAGARGPQTRMDSLATAVILGLVVLTGIVSGIVALFGIPKYGRKGILLPALTGLVIWGFLAVIAIPTFSKARARAQQIAADRANRTVLTPAVRSATATRFEDASLGIAFDLPDGYKAVSAEQRAVYEHLFLKTTAQGATYVLMVKQLDGTLSKKRLRTEDMPAGRQMTATTLSWRGLDVDAVRVPEVVQGINFITLNVQVPLEGRAVQLGFSGPVENEAEVRAIAAKLLASLEGESTW